MGGGPEAVPLLPPSRAGPVTHWSCTSASSGLLVYNYKPIYLVVILSMPIRLAANEKFFKTYRFSKNNFEPFRIHFSCVVKV